MTGPGAGTRRLLGPLLAVLLVTTACTGARSDEPHGAAAGPTGYVAGPYEVRPGVVLGTPVDDPDTQAAEHPVVARLLELVARTPPGERIRIITRSFSLRPVADALIDAHERGVAVQVIANRHASKDFKAVARMKEAIGTSRRKESFIYLSRGSGRGPRTATHQKTWTFTKVGDSRRVVVVGSANLSYYSTQQYSDMYVFVGRRDVWRVFDRDFRDQVGLEPPRGPGYAPVLGRHRVWFFPGWDLDTDPVQAVLRDLPARGTHLRFAMYAWHGERGRRIAEIVAAKARAGARVQVIALNIGREIVRVLRDAGVEVHSAAYDDGDDVHSKLSLLSWTDADGTPHRHVLTGSDNFGTPSLPRDEVVVDIDATGRRSWARYVRWFDGMIERAVAEGH